MHKGHALLLTTKRKRLALTQRARRNRMRAEWNHSRFRYLSELLALEPVASLAVEVQGFDKGGGWRPRLSAVLYRNGDRVYWREAWMADAVVLVPNDDALRGPFREHLADVLTWASEVRPNVRPSITVREQVQRFAWIERKLSDDTCDWIGSLRDRATEDAGAGGFAWLRW